MFPEKDLKEEKNISQLDKKKKIRKINPKDKEFIDFIVEQSGSESSKNNSPIKKE